MRSFYLFLTIAISILSCKTQEKAVSTKTKTNSKDFREFKVDDSKYIDRDVLFNGMQSEIDEFRGMSRYNDMILEKTIPELQQAVYDGELSYQIITLFYLERIYRYDRNNKKSLNSIISVNPKAVEDAYSYDLKMEEIKKENLPFNPYSLMGLPILLKDNINTESLPTTAGAAILRENKTGNAKLVQKLIENDAIVLGKTNLSEWAYYFCGDCPSGYSAVGGQTFNPYGRRTIDTGGSSSGSGAAVAANFAVAAIGTETAGSILSPASQHSLVGYKPTVGMISGSGVIPISSYLDTAGPMTKSVVDNAIVMNAVQNLEVTYPDMITQLDKVTLEGKRFGVFPEFKSNPLYVSAIAKIESLGATIVELEQREVSLEGFRKILNVDMRNDLPAYFMGLGNEQYRDYDVESIVQWNKQNDSSLTMPYGQRIFEGILKEPAVDESEYYQFKRDMTTRVQDHFNYYLQAHNLEGFLSINNYTAAHAAIAFFPAMTVPMGYDDKGTPFGLTFIAPNEEDMQLFLWAAAYEQATNHRKTPYNYAQ